VYRIAVAGRAGGQSEPRDGHRNLETFFRGNVTSQNTSGKCHTFGHTGDERSLLTHKYGEADCRVRDVNGDGRVDLVRSFLVKLTGFQLGDGEGVSRA
jgi:hypothetical protein